MFYDFFIERLKYGLIISLLIFSSSKLGQLDEEKGWRAGWRAQLAVQISLRLVFSTFRDVSEEDKVGEEKISRRKLSFLFGFHWILVQEG